MLKCRFLLLWILHDIVWISWICGLVTFITLRKFSVIIASKISSISFFLSYPYNITFMCMLCQIYLSHNSWIFCSIFWSVFFLLTCLFGIVYWLILKVRESLFTCVQPTNNPTKAFFISVAVFLISRISFYLNIFISSLILPICSFMLFYPLASLA